MAKLFIVIGAIFLVLGVVLYYFPSALSWFGRLPGDIRIEKEHGAFYFPITSMIILSVILSLVTWLFRR